VGLWETLNKVSAGEGIWCTMHGGVWIFDIATVSVNGDITCMNRWTGSFSYSNGVFRPMGMLCKGSTQH
jgi:hypothetical protein